MPFEKSDISSSAECLYWVLLCENQRGPTAHLYTISRVPNYLMFLLLLWTSYWLPISPNTSFWLQIF